AGARMALGKEVQTVYRFDKAERILSLDADFLLNDAGSLRYARDFSDKRRVRSEVDKDGKASGLKSVGMNRLYVIESTPSITGAMADERMRVAPSQIEVLARAIAVEVGVAGAAAGNLSEAEKKWVGEAVADLKSAASVVVVGRNMPP